MTKPQYRRQLLCDYLAATRNEIAVELLYLSISGLDARDIGYLPRAPRWIARARRAPRSTRVLGRLLGGLWSAGGAPAFFLAELIRYGLLRRRQLADAPPPVRREAGAVLALSARVCDVLVPPAFTALPSTWLLMPWAPQHKLPAGAVPTPMLTLLDTSDLWQSFCDAVAVNRVLARRKPQAPWLLQGYTALRWFLTRRAVDRLGGPLVMTEHFDRWAVLADRSVRARRRAPVPTACTLALVQHGAMGRLGTKPADSHSLDLPCRLGSVGTLHAYNADEAAAFREQVLDRRAARQVSVAFFKPRIALRDVSGRADFGVLFVGHPLCERFHIALFGRLQAQLECQAYYKPHPTAPMSAELTGMAWQIVAEPTTFPRVDMLISYPSTLVIEYESEGIPAAVHAMNIDEATELDAFAATVVDMARRMQASTDPLSSPRITP